MCICSHTIMYICTYVCMYVCTYIHMVQGLRLLDPSGVVLEQVCTPVREYLKTREDTVRCIVASLTDDSSNELADVSFDVHTYKCRCVKSSTVYIRTYVGISHWRASFAGLK